MYLWATVRYGWSVNFIFKMASINSIRIISHFEQREAKFTALFYTTTYSKLPEVEKAKRTK